MATKNISVNGKVMTFSTITEANNFILANEKTLIVTDEKTGIQSIDTKQQERIDTQRVLTDTIAKWMGYYKEKYNYSNRQLNKKFYNEFGETVTGMLSVPKADMDSLINDVEDSLRWLR